MNPVDALAAMLRPAGGGVFTVSTGRAEQLALQRRLYGAKDSEDVGRKWRASLAEIARARVAILGVPSDTGAGLARGASAGPAAVRAAALDLAPDFPDWARREAVVDVGDVAVVPQLLHDEMTSEGQLAACRRALYPTLDMAVAATLPVSPLSIAERTVDVLLAMNPGLRLLVLGGDHSVAWPVVAALGRAVREPWGIIHVDAHTDLLSQRLGIKHCFATWAFHANEVLGRGGRLIQVGIRKSGHGRAHWESTLGVRQIWADEVRGRGEAAVLDEVAAHLRALGVRRVYLSNDIDGTDAAAAPSTGAPEPAGLTVDFVRALIARVGKEVSLLGGDVMEVAPTIGSAEDARRTCQVGARYMLDTLAVMR